MAGIGREEYSGYLLMVSVSPWLGDRLIFTGMHANHAYVGAGLTATFTFNVAKVAPFCKPYATLIFINADGMVFALAGRPTYFLCEKISRQQQCHQHLRERAIHRAISQRPQNLIAVGTAPTSARSVAVRPAPTRQATCPPCRARRDLCGNKPFGPSGRGHVTQSQSEAGLRERY